jgi:hypothetical protein
VRVSWAVLQIMDPVATGSRVPSSNGMPAIFRPATEEDLIRDRENRELARKAFAYCRECIRSAAWT